MRGTALCIALVVLGLGACGKKKEADPAMTAGKEPAGSAVIAKPTTEPNGSGAGAEAAPGGPGVTVTSTINPEYAGTYDKVFAQLSNGTEPVLIAFVRGCPSAVCTDNPFELETMAAKCPKAFLAVATLKAEVKDDKDTGDTKPKFKDPKPGHLASDLVITGPGENPSTITLAAVALEITDLGPDGVIGSASQSTTESKVGGAFKASICGRM